MTDTKRTRTAKTPAQRATEQVAVLSKRLDRMVAAQTALAKQAAAMSPDIEALAKRLAYAKSSPDLPPVARPPVDEPVKAVTRSPSRAKVKP